MGRGLLHRRVARCLDQFGRRAQETAALPTAACCTFGDVVEDGADALGKRTLRLRKPFGEEVEIGLVAGGEIGGDQIVLAAEMIIERLLGEARLLGHRVHADGAHTLAIEQAAGRFDDFFPGLCGVSGHGNLH